MIFVAGHEDEVVDECRRRNQKIDIRDQASSLVEKAIDCRGPVDDLFRQRVDGAGPALLKEGRNLPACRFRMKPSQDLIASGDRKSEAAMLAQVPASVPEDLPVTAFHDLGESVRVEEGEGMRRQGSRREKWLRSSTIASTSAMSLSDRPS